jgi:hypothetical protein
VCFFNLRCFKALRVMSRHPALAAAIKPRLDVGDAIADSAF